MDDIYCIGAKNLKSVLSLQFRIPEYQRDYSWNKDNAQKLWDDVLNNSEDGYLLGSIVVIKDNNFYDIVDGQQRLVTLTLMFCAIRDCLHNKIANESPSRKSLIDNINNRIAKIQLNTTDSNIFQKICDNVGDINDKKIIEPSNQLSKSQKKIIDNYKYFYNKFDEYYTQKFDFVTKCAENIEDIRKKIEEISDGIIFSFIIALKEDHAFQIFDALNTTGEKLTQANIIKNYLVKESGKNKEENKKRWEKILSEISVNDHDGFLYESLVSRNVDAKIHISSNGKQLSINKNNMSVIIKKVYSDKNINLYLDELDRDKNCATYCRNPNAVGSDLKKIKIIFVKLNLIKAHYIRVPILTASRRWGMNSKEFHIISECLLIFFFKYKIIYDGDPDIVKKVTRTVTRLIIEGKNINEIINSIILTKDLNIDTKRIDDEDFSKKFCRYIHKPSPDIARYILISFEEYLRMEDNTDIIVDYNDFELEHILPKDDRKWDQNNFFEDKDYNNEKIDIFKHRLGNLTLLNSQWNRSMKNETFLKKLKGSKKFGGYNDSDLKINIKYLSNYECWNKKTINEREKKLYELAERIWVKYEHSIVQEHLPIDQRPQ